uniref:AP complex subunit beta n=1 Tax=Heterorhabditis bacteriophora TaxID=37862 RepID=A0A1I7XT09_HETBA
MEACLYGIISNYHQHQNLQRQYLQSMILKDLETADKVLKKEPEETPPSSVDASPLQVHIPSGQGSRVTAGPSPYASPLSSGLLPPSGLSHQLHLNGDLGQLSHNLDFAVAIAAAASSNQNTPLSNAGSSVVLPMNQDGHVLKPITGMDPSTFTEWHSPLLSGYSSSPSPTMASGSRSGGGMSGCGEDESTRKRQVRLLKNREAAKECRRKKKVVTSIEFFVDSYVLPIYLTTLLLSLFCRSALFPDVVNCMQTDNVELKKLVYLYLMNYAKSQPDLAIMAVNTFVKDCEDPNPLIRALAVRTMGCIRVDKITEYLCEPLRKCMKDEDPYVRKTAAVCVAKLHDMNPSLVEEQGFVELLNDLLSDANPMVVANAVAALTEINEQRPLIEVNSQMVNKLLTALNECTEWGQVFILDALAGYRPRDEREAQNICERISPRLAHANAAVVLSTVKVLMKLVDLLPSDSDFINQLTKKLAPPMVFFVKYNDPIYVKMEKLDIMIRLAQQSNIAQVLSELKEYATEVDVDFVRKSVRAIGRCAIKVEQSSERCVATLLELIQTKVNYVVQEAVVVIKDIFRKYPNRYESIISTLCENLDTLDEPEARASMIWIIGEYAERIDNADELLESFVEGFHDENTQVQLQLLTAVVKLFLKRPADTQQLVQRVLSLATQDSDNPDLRDRGYIYWRLLSADPAAAKQVVLAEKPLISEETDLLEPSLLDQLVCYIGSLASVYHKPPTSFVDTARQPLKSGVSHSNGQSSIDSQSGASSIRPAPTVIPSQDNLIADLLSLDLSSPMGATSVVPCGMGTSEPTSTTSFDPLTNLGMPVNASQPSVPAAPMSGLADIFGSSLGMSGAMSTGYQAPKQVWLDAAKAKGMQLMGTFTRRGGRIYMDMTITNKAMQALSGFAIQLNKNSFGLTPAEALNVPTPIMPGQSFNVSLACDTNGAIQKMDPLTNLQVIF